MNDSSLSDDFSFANPGARPANVLIMADRGVGGDEACRAIEAASARSIGRIGWDEAPARLGDHAVVDVILVEAESASDDQLDDVLPRLDTLARATDARIVVALDQAQIDRVTASLFGTHVQWLCTPGLTDRVAALSVAGIASTQLADSLREAESERLRRLNEEVARIAQTLARLASRDDGDAAERPDMLGDRRTGYAATPATQPRPVDPQDVRRAIRSRRLREQFFPATLVEDPGWDMLLDLFAAELEDRGVSVSSLCIAAAVAPTTALRWIGKMTEAGLFERRPDPFDRRRAFMMLTEKARQGMHFYCRAVREAGLAIA
ncbi:winged helix DNA-binding protein [Hephaestia mangrovi]|uniref:winged helix DNA-binding protein n=1 Tax=Hephaestia mangrovi TaxID=2873268 RepID=UPI001CA63DBB|nr:winged helix DNA-binding protein [Hephaestia mangrovi]MBY8829628.1 winged helix DNA-binding protein [Hephaestia mangrovi]